MLFSVVAPDVLSSDFDYSATAVMFSEFATTSVGQSVKESLQFESFSAVFFFISLLLSET